MSGAPVIILQPLSKINLERLAAGLGIVFATLTVAEGALPPPRVATRSLDLLRSGSALLWAVPFNVIVPNQATIVGGCGFKGPPVAGQVEIGYGIAPEYHRCGFGSRAVTLLLKMAEAAGVYHVVAHIAPQNNASAALAGRVGFIKGLPVIDADDEVVVRWHWRSLEPERTELKVS